MLYWCFYFIKYILLSFHILSFYSIGECFDPVRHRNAQGTEIKAITYSAMTIFSRHGEWRSTEENTFLHADQEHQQQQHSDEEEGEPSSSTINNHTQVHEAQKRPYEYNNKDTDTSSPQHKKRRGERKDAIDLYFIVDI